MKHLKRLGYGIVACFVTIFPTICFFYLMLNYLWFFLGIVGFIALLLVYGLGMSIEDRSELL